MKVMIDSFQKYENIFRKEGLDFYLLSKGENDSERLVSLLTNIGSKFLYPKEDDVSLHMYANKLLDHAFNFILCNKNCDIAFFSIYANDFVTKTAFCSSIGILPSYRGRNIASILIKFGIDFCKEKGMELLNAEVDKKNPKMLSFLKRYGFQLKNETDRHTYIVSKDLRIF